jgi:5-methylcytosine-specific restriction endonuclease McrA
MDETHNPYRVEPRKQLTAKQRLQLLIENGGKCCICGHPIFGFRERWDDYELEKIPFVDEHISPLWLNGTNEFSNRGPAHEACAREKTSKEATERSSGRKAAEFHFGAKRPKKIMPGSRRHHLKKKLDGRVVLRSEDERGKR